MIWDTDSWHVTPAQKDVTSYPVHRAALCMRLRRVTARRVAHEDELFVLLTKFRQGTAQSKQPLHAHERFLPWKSMMDIVRRETARKWMIAGALETHEVQLAYITKTHMTGWDPTSVFSSDKTIACVAHGFDLASCQNHDEN